MIRITLDLSKGSWSFIGRAAMSIQFLQPAMNLGTISDTEEIGDTEHSSGKSKKNLPHLAYLFYE
jgi:hypothetical protein